MKEKNYYLLCRICLKRSSLCSNIYVGRSSDKDPIYEIINYVYDLQISVDDGLPGYICQRCLDVVKEFKVYKRNAHKAKTELLRNRRTDDVFIKEEIAEIGSENEEFPSYDEGSPAGDQVTETVCSVSLDTNVCPAHVETWEEDNFQEEKTEKSFGLDNDLEKTGEFGDGRISYLEEGSPIKTEILGGNTYTDSSIKQCQRKNQRIWYYQCEKCGIRFLKKQTLQEHLSLVCRNPRHSNIGERGYPELVHSLEDSTHIQDDCKLKLTEDSKIKELVKNYECEECGRKFARCHSFKAHLRVHSQENPNRCTVCGRSFSQRFDLVRHYESIHLKLKPFQCVECGKCFARKYHLVRHIKGHRVVVME